VVIVICPEQLGQVKVVGPTSSKSKKSSSSSFLKYFKPTKAPKTKIPARLPPMRSVLFPLSSFPLALALAFTI